MPACRSDDLDWNRDHRCDRRMDRLDLAKTGMSCASWLFAPGNPAEVHTAGPSMPTAATDTQMAAPVMEVRRPVNLPSNSPRLNKMKRKENPKFAKVAKESWG